MPPDTINNLVQELQKVFDVVLESHQTLNQSTQKQLIYLQKLFMMDLDSLSMFVEMQNEFILLMPTSLIAYYLHHQNASKKQIRAKLGDSDLQLYFDKTLLDKTLAKLDERKKAVVTSILQARTNK